jgi:zinc/manganese transport system substrate-binding protein
MKALPLLVVAAILLAEAPVSAAPPIRLVAAENFYGDVAQQIGGRRLQVTSILKNPDQDPHLFELTPSVARAIAGARIVIANGIGYDSWIERLLRAAGGRNRQVIIVAALLGRKSGDNPHIWYDPKTMPALARTLAEDLGRADPAEHTFFARRLARFEQSMQPIERKVAALRARLSGTPVTATEPVFGYMLEALGMRVRNTRFQLAVMNNTEPSASAVAAFEKDLKAHRVRLLVYNSQATGPVAERMRKIALAAHIPVVGVTETEPPGKTYQAWVLDTLVAVERALLE